MVWQVSEWKEDDVWRGSEDDDKKQREEGSTVSMTGNMGPGWFEGTALGRKE
jgi:hypothetical protein